MVMKGSLAAFKFSLLKDLTVDERRNVREGMKRFLLDGGRIHDFIVQSVYDFLIKDGDIVELEEGKKVLAEFPDKLSWFVKDMDRSDLYEPINIQRLNKTIAGIPNAYSSNLDELRRLKGSQESIIAQVFMLVDDVAEASTHEKLRTIGMKGYSILCKIAGNDQGEMYPEDKINESHKTHIEDMSSRFSNGYIFKWTLENELNKNTVRVILDKLSSEQTMHFDETCSDLDRIRDAVLLMYDLNHRQILFIKRVYSLLQEIIEKKDSSLL